MPVSSRTRPLSARPVLGSSSSSGMLRKAICVALATVCASCVLASASRGRVRAPAMCGQPYRMALRGGGKNKDRRHNLEGAEYGDARKEKIAERVAVAAEELQEKLKLAREEVQIENIASVGRAPADADREAMLMEAALEQERELSEERWSYQKVAADEMRKAEEKSAARQREFEEYQSKRRSGEIQDETTEVIDTLRWPSAQDGLAGKSRQQRKERAPLEEPVEEEVQLAGEEDEPELTVKEWLELHHMYAETFAAEGWDNLEAVHTMTEEDMLEIGVKRGHVRRLMLAMGREPPPMRMQSVSRSGSLSMARGASFARNRMEGSHARGGWGYQEHDGYSGRGDWREQADRESGLKANVGVAHGPGGSSRLTEAGGLGAFLTGGVDEEDDYYTRSARR